MHLPRRARHSDPIFTRQPCYPFFHKAGHFRIFTLIWSRKPHLSYLISVRWHFPCVCLYVLPHETVAGGPTCGRRQLRPPTRGCACCAGRKAQMIAEGSTAPPPGRGIEGPHIIYASNRQRQAVPAGVSSLLACWMKNKSNSYSSRKVRFEWPNIGRRCRPRSCWFTNSMSRCSEPASGVSTRPQIVSTRKDNLERGSGGFEPVRGAMPDFTPCRQRRPGIYGSILLYRAA